MDNLLKNARESLIEDKLKKIIFGGKSPRHTVKSDKSEEIDSFNVTNLKKQ